MSINIIDQQKLMVIIYDTMDRLKFLQQITSQQDDASVSSELAGWEISKLLEQQTTLEDKYAELVNKRTVLTGITNRQKLIETQNKIREVAQNLKDSTKKLCRLFKENPDIEKDAVKVKAERADLVCLLENLISQVQTNQLYKFQQQTTQELEKQDQLRKLMQDEKELTTQIKKVTREHAMETNEVAQEREDKEKKIQIQKETLLKKRNKAQIKKQYEEKEHKAEIDTKQRLNEQEQKKLKNKIAELNNQIQTENLVHSQLVKYLTEKEETIKQEAEEWSRKTEDQKQKLEDEIEDLKKEKEEKMEKLEKMRQANSTEELAQRERDRKELEEAERKREEELKLIRLDNAIKLIQLEYTEWKAAGGGKKKKRGGKKKAKK